MNSTLYPSQKINFCIRVFALCKNRQHCFYYLCFYCFIFILYLMRCAFGQMCRLTKHALQSKAKQRCVMGIGMCLYAQLVKRKISSAEVQLYYNVISVFI